MHKSIAFARFHVAVVAAVAACSPDDGADFDAGRSQPGNVSGSSGSRSSASSGGAAPPAVDDGTDASSRADAAVGDGDGGSGAQPGCRAVPAAPPDCAYEAPLVIDDATPAENGVVVIRDRCFRQPDTVALNSGGSETEPAIRIRTQRPVLLERVVTVSAGAHVVAEGFADVTIRDSSGFGLEPTVDDVPHGPYLEMYGFNRATVERSLLSHTRGLELYLFDGGEDASRNITIRQNVVRNIDGRCRNVGNCGNTGTYLFSNFVSFNVATGTNIEIAWNDVLNEPGESSAADNIGLYRAAGTADHPLRVNHNAIRGGYPFPVGEDWTGTCLTTDGDAASVGQVGFVEADDNLCVSVGLNIAGGHDSHYRNNTYVSAGLLPNGAPLQTCFWCVGGIFDFYGGGNLVNNSIENLRVSLPSTQDGYWPTPPATNSMTVEEAAEPATLATEANAYQAWCDGAASAGIVLGH